MNKNIETENNIQIKCLFLIFIFLPKDDPVVKVGATEPGDPPLSSKLKSYKVSPGA